jgi:hypothetical protein
MFNNSELEQIELTIEEAQKSIDKMEALERLRKNADFKVLIEGGFLKEEAARLVLMKAEPNLQDEFQQKMLDNMIIAVGYFRQYLNKIYQFGRHAEQAIESHRETRNEIMAEIE